MFFSLFLSICQRRQRSQMVRGRGGQVVGNMDGGDGRYCLVMLMTGCLIFLRVEVNH